jgi:hypothetical protein
MRIDVGHHDVDRLRLAADIAWLPQQSAILGVLHRADHDHAVATDELRMRNRAILARHDQVPLEPEGGAKPSIAAGASRYCIAGMTVAPVLVLAAIGAPNRSWDLTESESVP